MPDRTRSTTAPQPVRHEEPETISGGRRRRGVWLPLLVALAAAVVLAVTLWGGGGSEDAAEDSAEDTAGASSSDGAGSEAADRSGRAPEKTWEQLVRRDADDPTALGDVDAPVVMLSYSDFQCPYCGTFARETEPKLIEEYVDEGLLRIEWRDFPYLGEESTTAAHAARAAGRQDAFWEFHDALYADQAPPNSGTLTEEHLIGMAGELGLDVDQFREDMRSREVREAVQADFEQGQRIGVTGTPAFVIDGVPVIGAQPLEVFTDTIDEAVSAAKEQQ